MSPSRKTSKRSPLKTPRKVSAGRGTFISDLKKLEKRFGQRNTAKLLGVNPRSLRRYKQGTRKPRFDVAYKLKRAESVTRGIRKTKSVKKKRARTLRAQIFHPELSYFEKKESFKYSDTDHIILYDVSKGDIPDLIQYLIEKNCGAAFIVLSGVDSKTKKRSFYSTEVMEINDFAEGWETLYEELFSRYEMRKLTRLRIDLVGITYNAPSLVERQKE